MAEKSIWVNLDEHTVDMRCLDKHFSEKGYAFVKQMVPGEEEAIITMGNQADAIISAGNEPWNEKALSAIAGKGKIIVRYGAGLDNIDMKCAARLGIPVANTIGANAPAVAEVALLHILNAGRRFSQCIEGVKAGKWPAFLPGNELNDKTVGLIGYGNIARQLVRMLRGFRLKVVAYDPFLNDEGQKSGIQEGVEFLPDMASVFRISDFVSLHIPFGDSTRGIIGASLFACAKPGQYLINTCRGGVIDEPELIEALCTKKLRGAGLDVLSKEPPDPGNPLLKMENVFITSHMGAIANESEYRSQLIIADIIISFFEGRIHPNIRNPEVLTHNHL